jgi:HEAT repeat protein
MPDDFQYPSPPDPLAGREEEFGDFPPSQVRDFPPVEPPSAGFIVQLFLVPALIVTVVVGVYLLFGRLAAGEQDWRKQLTDIRSDNPHVRWRGALGLAQMLQADVTADGVRLAENRDVAIELSNLLRESLDSGSPSEDDLKQQEFLARTLGTIDVPDVTLPVLVEAMQPVEDREVRKNAIASVASTAHRLQDRTQPFDESAVVGEVIAATGDHDAMIRHLATYALGLFESPLAEQRLLVLLDHGDEMTRVNAAIALARHDSLAGLPTFEEILKSSDSVLTRTSSATSASELSEETKAQFEGLLKVTNTLKALHELSAQLDSPTRTRLVKLLTPLAEQTADSRLRVEAQTLIQRLEDGA